MINQIRNFCIIAHIDHGKSTLADRMLEITGTIEKRQMKEQLLDQMEIERERGITIKLQPVRMEYQGYILNLIDTPGHVDFSYEVSRSLAAVEGAILLVDATQGIQAQTLSTLHLAIEQHLVIIPVINKIDLPAANIDQSTKDLQKLLSILEDEILFTSGKTGQGVKKLLDKIVKKIPPPKGSSSEPTRFLVFDSKYDFYRGVVAYVRAFDGKIIKNDTIKMIQTGSQDKALEVGYFRPYMTPYDAITAGEIGYIVTGFKDVSQVQVGDTATIENFSEIKSLPGYKKVQPNVFSSIFTIDSSFYPQLRDALAKLKLNDAALTFEPEKSLALGFGFRCGFLGLLHLEIIKERLEREFNLDLITTTPSVSYKIIRTEGTEEMIYSAGDLPNPSAIKAIYEPIAAVEIIAFQKHLGNIMQIINLCRGELWATDYFEGEKIIIKAKIPLSDLIIGFFDRLKSASSGYGSMSYRLDNFQESNLAKLDIILAGEEIRPLSRIIPKSQIDSIGRQLVTKIKELLPRQNFIVPIQAACNGKIIARETLPAFRKDVIEKLYGGDVTRKQKLLNKQKKGKKRMAKYGKVEIPSDVFLDLLKS